MLNKVRSLFAIPINCSDKNALSTATFSLILYRHFRDFFMFSTPISWEINLSNLRQQQIAVRRNRPSRFVEEVTHPRARD